MTSKSTRRLVQIAKLIDEVSFLIDEFHNSDKRELEVILKDDDKIKWSKISEISNKLNEIVHSKQDKCIKVKKDGVIEHRCM